jgi:rubrerythrin
MNQEQVQDLLYQALETEMGGVQIYETAIECAVNEDLKEEWEEYLEQTKKHVQKMREVLESVGLDPKKETPGRQVVRHIGESLVKAMQMARRSGGDPEAGELVAAECIVLAETKDHLNWELIGEVVKEGSLKNLETMKRAHQEVEEEEDEHLYHTLGWTRELWMECLGFPAVIPPPEEKQDVKTMMEAARAKENRLRKNGRSRNSRIKASSSSRSPKRRGASASSKKKSSSRGRVSRGKTRARR